MVDNGQSGRESTRREYLQYGGAVIVGGLFAGCTGGSRSETMATTSESEVATTATTEAAMEVKTKTTTEAAESCPVSIEPVDEVTFDSVPEAWITSNGSWADMGVALGFDMLIGVWLPGRYRTQYYDGVPDMSVDKSSIRQPWDDSGVGKEQFYELDVDVHIVDPNFFLNRGQRSEADIEEIGTQAGPSLDNSIFLCDYAQHEDYRYYTLYEAFEKFVQVLQREDRFEAFEQIHEEFQSNLVSAVPAQGEQPSAAVIWAGGNEPEEFYPYVTDEETSFKHLNDLKVSDALATAEAQDLYSNRGMVDFETLLKVDLKMLLVRGQEAKTRREFQSTMVSFMGNHEVAGELATVRNGDVYRVGTLYQGPITNLVVMGCLVRALYDADERLFGAQRVVDVTSGNL